MKRGDDNETCSVKLVHPITRLSFCSDSCYMFLGILEDMDSGFAAVGDMTSGG